MCRACWYRVPPPTRAAVNRAWRDYLAGVAPLDALRLVQMQAVLEAET